MKLSFEDGTTLTRHRTWEQPPEEVEALTQAVQEILTPERVAGRAVRLLGVGVVNLQVRA